MPIYQKPTKELMKEFAQKNLKKGQLFTRKDAMDWFSQNYPKIKSNTVSLHVDGMSVNSNLRKHHTNIHVNSGHNLFIKVDKGTYRLWEPDNDPTPIYRSDLIAHDNKVDSKVSDIEEEYEDPEYISSSEFAYENDLKNYLAKNLELIEPGLSLYEEEGFSGLEFPAGGRYIDILAIDKNKSFVVIELKVSRGYDRVVGQILRYMSWIEQNMSNDKKIRGIIIASHITEDLKLATSRIKDVSLYEYELSLKIKSVV